MPRGVFVAKVELLIHGCVFGELSQTYLSHDWSGLYLLDSGCDYHA